MNRLRSPFSQRPVIFLSSVDFRQICAARVDVRGVDEIHAGVRRLVEDPKGLSFVGLFAERSCAKAEAGTVRPVRLNFVNCMKIPIASNKLATAHSWPREPWQSHI